MVAVIGVPASALKKVSRQVTRLRRAFSFSGCICADASQWTARRITSSNSVRVVLTIRSERSNTPMARIRAMDPSLNSSE